MPDCTGSFDAVMEKTKREQEAECVPTWALETLSQRAAHAVTQENTAKHDTAPPGPLQMTRACSQTCSRPFLAPGQMEALVRLAKPEFKKRPWRGLLNLGLCSKPRNKAQTVATVLSLISS